MEEAVTFDWPPSPHSGTRPWDLPDAAHSLRRIGFGATPEDVQVAIESGREATIEALLQKDECDDILEKGLPSVLAVGELKPIAAWWMARLLDGGAPFVERIALMWHNHFATSNAKVADARLMHEQAQLFRDHGRGDFRVLLGHVARDPAMLLWLDGNENRLGNPNENFARELFELFALGLGSYDERDVQEAARAFTGWGVDRRRFVARDRYHDGGVKEVLGNRGAFHGDDVLKIVLERPECPRWIARRLLVEFVHPHPLEEEVATWANVLVEEDWHIERTCRRLFHSPLFLSPRARRSRIAAPIELVVGAARAIGVRPAPHAVTTAVTEMGQALYRPPSVKGWNGGRDWIHAGTWLARHNALVRLAHLAVDQGRAWSTQELLTALLPDGAPDALFQAVKAQRNKRSSTALADAIALALTSPEAQLT